MKSGWGEVTIGDVCTKPQYGWTTKARTDNGEVRLLRTTDITSGQIDWSSVPFCTEAPPDLEKYLICENDIVISRAGSVGVSYLITKVEPAVFASYLIRFCPGPQVLPKYLAYFLKSPAYWKQIADYTSGIAIPNVNASKLQDVRLPLAPLDQQRRIVAEIEKQFSRLDEAVAGLKRVKANLKRYKAAILKAAVEGRLVPTEADLARRKGRSYETGAQLLQRILETRRSQWQGKGKYKEPAVLDTTDLPELPEGWAWVTASQTFREVKDGTHETPLYQESGVPFITQKHVKAAGFVFDDYAYISRQDHDHFYQRSDAELGDILVSMIGVNRGESCIINVSNTFSIKNVGLMKPHHALTNVKFIQYYLSSPTGSRLLLRKSKGGAQPFVGLSELRAWPVALPPVAEQHRIVAEVDRLLSITREAETGVETNLKRAQSLRQAILSKAFTGDVQ